MTKFMIVDGNSLACRAEFASNDNDDLKNSKGKITGGTYRFINMFDRLLQQLKPTHIVVVWDVNRNTWRRQLYSEYKMNREINPNNINKENLHITYKDIKEILNTIGILNIEFDGYEGDDLVGTFANISTADKNFIISGDKDTFQLVDQYTNIIFPKNGFKELEIINEEYIKNKYNVTPKQFIELKALIGDMGDNIPGINGCGEKSAVKLLQHFGNIKNIINNDNFDNVKGINKKIKNNIKDWQPMAEIILKLVTIDKHVPIEIEFEDCILNINWNNAINIFKELEFNSLIKKIDKLYKGE